MPKYSIEDLYHKSPDYIAALYSEATHQKYDDMKARELLHRYKQDALLKFNRKVQAATHDGEHIMTNSELKRMGADKLKKRKKLPYSVTKVKVVK